MNPHLFLITIAWISISHQLYRILVSFWSLFWFYSPKLLRFILAAQNSMRGFQAQQAAISARKLCQTQFTLPTHPPTAEKVSEKLVEHLATKEPDISLRSLQKWSQGDMMSGCWTLSHSQTHRCKWILVFLHVCWKYMQPFARMFAVWTNMTRLW